MTTGAEKPEDNAADRLAGMLFDSEADDFALSESATEISEAMDGQEIRRAADLHLVHSLMIQISSHDETARERRIQQVMQGIDADSEVRCGSRSAMPDRLHNFLRPLIRYGIAAAVIVSVTILLTQMASNEAMAAMDKMITAIDQSADRTYRIIVKDSKTGTKAPRPDRFTDMQGLQKERATLDGATLYLRGNDKFVLYRLTPSGETVMNGSNGPKRWLIRPRKPVLVSNDPEAFRIPMPEELADLLTMNFRTTLLRIRDNYEIKYLDGVQQEQEEPIAWMYLGARKRNSRFRGPRNIRIWAHHETGVLERIEFVDIRLQGRPELKKLIVDLADEKALPENWFAHQSHHQSDAEIEFLEDARSEQLR